MSGEVLVWNGRAADPAPSEREALVGLEEVAGQAESKKGAEPAPQGGQLVASEDEPSRGGSASGFERM